MPSVKLPTGVDLYYETHGQGEPLIFVPSTAYSGEVWKPSQMPLASSLNLIFTIRAAAAVRCRRRAYTPFEQMALDIIALMDHLQLPGGALDRSLHGRTYRAVAGGEFSGARQEFDHGGERFRHGGPGRFGLRPRICRIGWFSIWSIWGLRNSSTRDRRVRHFFTKDFRAAHRDQVESFSRSPGRPTRSSILSFTCAWRGIISKGTHRWAMFQAPDVGSDRRSRHRRQQS
jgi:hypothetical protein